MNDYRAKLEKELATLQGMKMNGTRVKQIVCELIQLENGEHWTQGKAEIDMAIWEHTDWLDEQATRESVRPL